MEHSFDTEIAKEYGVNCAIILQNVYFWVLKNEANNQNFYDGKYWTYNSKKAFSKLFGYMTERQIDYALKHLIDEGLIITGNYNKNTYDRTLWYALTDKALCLLHNFSRYSTDCSMHSTNLLNAGNNFVEPIPDNKPDIQNTSYSSNNTYLSDISNNTAITDCQKADKGNSKDTDIGTEHHIGQTEQNEEVKKEKRANNTEMKVSFVKGLVAKKEPRTKEEIMIAHLQKSLDNLNKGKELKDALKNWVAILVKNKGGIQTEQIKLALEELESITKDETKQLEIVKEASQLGYLKFKWVKLETAKTSRMCNPENELPSFEEIEARDRKRFEDDIKSGKYKEPEKKFDEQGRRYF